MQEVVLYLENPEPTSPSFGEIHTIPLFDGYNVSLNFKFTDIENFKPTGTFSSTFRCPLDEELLNFIGAVYDVNYNGWFNPKNKIPAYITANTLPTSNGHVQYLSAYRTAAGWEIEFRYFGETPDIKTALGDKKLSDIEDLVNLNHELNYANVTDDDLEDGNVNYFLIDKGQNFSENGEVGTRPVFNASQRLNASDFTPAVLARYLWDNIWLDSGFVIDSPTNFPDLLDINWVPFFNGTPSPINTEAPNEGTFQLRLDTADEYLLTTDGTFPVTTMTEDFDNGGNVVLNEFTAPFSGLFKFRWWATLQAEGTGTATQCRLLLQDGSDDIIFSSQYYNIQITPFTIFGQNEIGFIMNAGDTIKMSLRKIGSSFSRDIRVRGTAGYDTQNGTGFEMFEVAEQYNGVTVDMIANAPNMRQYDFITSILKMYNGVVVPDRNIPNKIRIESMNDYLQSGDTVDWTGKLDLSKDFAIKPTNEIQARDLEFTYTKDGDALNKIYNDQQNKVFGSLITKDNGILTNLRSDFATGTKKVEIQFAPTPCNNIPGTNIPIPKFFTETGELFQAKPRILYHAFSPSGFQVYDDDTATLTSTTVRVLSNFDDYDLADEQPSIDTLDLNFGAELYPSGYLQTTFGAPLNNLFNRYWSDYIREIYDPSARIFEGHFALSINDILTFGFDDLIFIKDAYWRILEIQGYGVGNDTPTKVKLLKILELDSECEYTPSVSNVDGTITMVDGAGSTSAGSQECCERYGYTWNGAACYWNAPTGGFRSKNAGESNSGFGSSNTEQLPNDSQSFVSRSTIRPGNFGAKYGGDAIESGQNNLGSIVHGQDLKMVDDLGGASLFGENAEAQHFGTHFGGGLNNGEGDTTQGRAQIGDIVFMGDGTVEDLDDTIELLIKGSDRLVLEDETVWGLSVVIGLRHYNSASAFIDKWLMQEYLFEIHKSNNVAGVTTAQISPDKEVGNLSAHFDLVIDATTDTTQHRFSLKTIATGSLPTTDIEVTMRMQYTQVR